MISALTEAGRCFSAALWGPRRPSTTETAKSKIGLIGLAVMGQVRCASTLTGPLGMLPCAKRICALRRTWR